MHYLAVHTKLLGTAPASWNFLASLPELRNPLVPRGEVPRVFISIKVHIQLKKKKKSIAHKVLGGHPRGLVLATNFFHEPQGNEIFSVNSICFMVTSLKFYIVAPFSPSFCKELF